jgi:dipeptidyl aminopeptidase/acylaminoacyl peptidase
MAAAAFYHAAMSRLRDALRRPGLPAIVSILVVIVGLVAAVLLGNAVGGAASRRSPDATGSPPPTLRAVAVEGGDHWRPVTWSPDGSTLLVQQDDRYALVEDGARLTPVDGRLVAFWPGGDRALSVVVSGSPEDRLLLKVPGEPDQQVAARPGIAAVGWSADGQSWAVADAEGVTAGLLGGSASQLGFDQPAAVAVSPAGERIAFGTGRQREGALGELLIVDLLRDERTRPGDVLIGAGDTLAWSPTGRFLAFSGRQAASSGLFLLRPGSGPPALVVPGADPRSVRWSPDGAWLAAARLAEAAPVTELLSVSVGATAVRVESLGVGRSTSFGPLPGMLATVEPGGRVVARPLAGGDSVELATGADPACPAVADAATRRVAYCDAAGRLLMVSLEQR